MSHKFLTYMNVFFLIMNLIFVVALPVVSGFTYTALVLHAGLVYYHSGKIEDES